MGKVVEVNGPLVTVELADVRIGEQVRIGRLELTGEVIARHGARALVQVYEPTESLRPGEPVEALGHPLSVELGPGLLGGIFDGVQRPLLEHARQHGDYVPRGVHIPPLDRNKLWRFEPQSGLATGTRIESGAVLGNVQETATIAHRIMVPPDMGGELVEIINGFLLELVLEIGKNMWLFKPLARGEHSQALDSGILPEERDRLLGMSLQSI